MIHNAARLFVTCCMVWVLLYLLIGPTSNGKLIFGSFIQDKAGPPVIGLIIPVFLAGFISCLFTIRRNTTKHVVTLHSTTSILLSFKNELVRLISNCQSSNSLCNKLLLLPLRFTQQCVVCISPNHTGDIDFNVVGFRLLFVPLLWYAIISTWRKCNGFAISSDEFWKEVANCFGMAAIVGFGFLLIPVSRHSIILHCMGWNPAAAVQLHAWTGRFILLGIFIHGIAHSLRWTIGQKHNWATLFFPPPKNCWEHIYGSEYKQQANGTAVIGSAYKIDAEKCNDLFRNWTGMIGFLLLVLIGASAFVRRRYYRLFYSIHIVAGPTVLVVSVLHWNRSMIYIAASALYYTACSFPAFTEHLMRRRNWNESQANIISSELIHDGTDSSRTVVNITFKASQNALDSFQPGQYVMLRVPSISNISHPFTVNATYFDAGTSNLNGTARNQYLRIMCRSTGTFTNAVSKAVDDANNKETNNEMPRMYIEGFHGPSQRIEQVLQHDKIVFAAAGIGITPYLSLLHAIQREHFSNITDPQTYELRHIELHWVCRDRNLIEFVKKEYFNPLLKKQRLFLQKKSVSAACSTSSFHIIVHYTGTQQQPSYVDTAPYTDIECPDFDSPGNDVDQDVALIDNAIAPFEPSRYSLASKQSYWSNMYSTVSFVLIYGVGFMIVWSLYMRSGTSSDNIFKRLYNPIFIVVYATIVSLAINYFGSTIQSACSHEKTEFMSLHCDKTYCDDTIIDSSSQNATEMSDMSPGNSLNERKQSEVSSLDLSSLDDCNQTDEYLSYIEERLGRPSIHQLVNFLDQGLSPGLFACGPTKFLDEVRTTVSHRCLARCRQCVRRERKQRRSRNIESRDTIAFYEESFEL
jgi:predicted ferric reductase